MPQTADAYVLFDFDGTLVNSLGLVVELYNGLAEEKGWRPLAPEEIPVFQGLGLRERFTMLGLPFYRLPFVGRELKRRYADRMADLEFVPGVPQMLESLSAEGFGLGIVSSNTSANIEAFMARQGVQLFRSVQSVRGLFGKHRALSQFLVEHGLSPRQALYVGDEQRDVVAANRCQMPSVAVTWGADLEDQLRTLGPSVLARTPEQVVSAARELLRP
jgi:phosphoglycolate phosphatase